MMHCNATGCIASKTIALHCTGCKHNINAFCCEGCGAFPPWLETAAHGFTLAASFTHCVQVAAGHFPSCAGPVNGNGSRAPASSTSVQCMQLCCQSRMGSADVAPQIDSLETHGSLTQHD